MVKQRYPTHGTSCSSLVALLNAYNRDQRLAVGRLNELLPEHSPNKASRPRGHLLVIATGLELARGLSHLRLTGHT